MQIEHQLVDKAQLHVAEGRVTDTQQVGLQLIARRIQRILQLAQGARGFRQQHLAAGDRRPPVFAQQRRDVVFHALLLLVHHALGHVDAVEDFRHRIFQRREHVAVPMEIVAALVGGVGGALEFLRHDRQLHRQTQRGEFALANIVIGNADTQRREAVNRVAVRQFAGKAVQQALAHHVVDRIVGAHRHRFMRLFKTLADMAKCINQLTFAHLAVQPFAVQGGDGEQKCETLRRERNREIIFPCPGDQFGYCLGKFTHSSSFRFGLCAMT